MSNLSVASTLVSFRFHSFHSDARSSHSPKTKEEEEEWERRMDRGYPWRRD